MGKSGELIRLARHATDAFVPWSFNHAGFAFNQRGFEGDLPKDARGKIALVTGANSGIGRATVSELARRKFEVWMLCRDASRGAEARDAIVANDRDANAHLHIVDVSSLDSVRRFADACALDRIDVLVHNAGVLPDDKHMSVDGIELTFATNVVGPFTLTALLMPRLARSNDARVIFVASGGMLPQKLDLTMPDVAPSSFDGVRAYANTKRAQVILAHMLAERLSGAVPVTFASMHPGWADTPAVRSSLPRFYKVMRPFLRSAREGADTVVWLAASPTPRGTRGSFWFDRRVASEYPLPGTRESQSDRDELLARCERMSGVKIGEPKDTTHA